MSGKNKAGREKGRKYINGTCSLSGPSCPSHSLYRTIPSTLLSAIMGLGNFHDLITSKQPKKIAIVSVGAQEHFNVWVARDVPMISQMAARKHRKAVVRVLHLRPIFSFMSGSPYLLYTCMILGFGHFSSPGLEKGRREQEFAPSFQIPTTH